MDSRYDITCAYSLGRPAVSIAAGRRGGFTLLDLLVSVAVMVVLIALLSPSLMAAHESARRIRCAVHMQQIGYAIHMYTDDMRGMLPPAQYKAEPRTSTSNRTAATPSPWANDTIMVRFEALTPGAERTEGGMAVTWDGLGVLFDLEYLKSPQAFYCPSHHGNHGYSVYKQDWVDLRGEIASNYQYRVPAQSAYLADLDIWMAILADGMETKLDYNHRIGNNYLRIDGGVSWYLDDDGSVFKSLPDDDQAQTPTRVNDSTWRAMEQPSL